MKKIMAVVSVVGAIHVFAAPLSSEPYESTTVVSSLTRAQAVVEPKTTFWSSAVTWNAGVIDTLRRTLSGLFVIIK